MVDGPLPSVQEYVDAARELLASRGGVVAAYLFGSTSTGSAKEPSDAWLPVLPVVDADIVAAPPRRR